MRQEGRGHYMPRGASYPQAYMCGIFSRNHPMDACQREGNALASGLVWCKHSKRYGKHKTGNCYYQTRGPNQQHQQARVEQRGYPNQGNALVGGNVVANTK